MNLTEQYPSRRVRHLLGFPRSLLYRTPTDAADLRAALLRLFADERVYPKSTRAASAGQPNRHPRAFALLSPPDFLVVTPSAFRRNPWFGKLLGYGRPEGGRHGRA
jgi:hypothetical protein